MNPALVNSLITSKKKIGIIFLVIAIQKKEFKIRSENLSYFLYLKYLLFYIRSLLLEI